MATWEDLVKFIDRTYKHEVLGEGLLKLVFNVDNLRSQVVFVEHAHNDSGADWFKVTSPVGNLSPDQAYDAARRLSGMILGGIIVEEDIAMVATAMPLKDVDPHEVTDSIERITQIADSHEADILGSDDF